MEAGSLVYFFLIRGTRGHAYVWHLQSDKHVYIYHWVPENNHIKSAKGPTLFVPFFFLFYKQNTENATLFISKITVSFTVLLFLKTTWALIVTLEDKKIIHVGHPYILFRTWMEPSEKGTRRPLLYLVHERENSSPLPPPICLALTRQCSIQLSSEYIECEDSRKAT